MHLLVLSAFRLDSVSMFVWIDRFVSMHLLVLSAFRLGIGRRLGSRHSRVSMHLLVLSAFRHRTIRWRSRRSLGLNAPSGAQCFPTSTWLRGSKPSSRRVSMHLLVLSAFRQDSSGVEHVGRSGLNAPSGAQCFPTWKDGHGEEATLTSQCTFWCSVLSDPMVRGCGRRGPVCLNAPSGAQCFPTRRQMEDHGYGACSVSMHLLVLSAFRLEGEFDCAYADLNVSMHLLVLSAFRHKNDDVLRQSKHVSMHLLVLSAFRLGDKWKTMGMARVLSQCTFWCSVLSDLRGSLIVHTRI